MKIFSITFLLFCTLAYSQEHGIDSKNVLYFEAKANSDDVFNLSYERNFKISNNDNLKLAGRMGIGLGFVDQAKDSMTARFSIPVEALLLYGRRHSVELGIGFIPTFGKAFTNVLKNPPVTYRNNENIYCLRIGYRFISDGDVVFRFSPMIEFPSVNRRKSEFVLGLSLGYAF